jgi:saccharopine dehydrogenase-like NADP-dependent oxidoreductase
VYLFFIINLWENMMTHTIFVAGSGGIGTAVAILLRHVWDEETDILFGDRLLFIAQKACADVEKIGEAEGTLSAIEMTGGWADNISHCDILLDCLPGSLAPQMARLAIKNNMHYVNLTEYVAETKEILSLAEGAQVGLALQSGLAPGFINVLGNGLFQQFCREYDVEKADLMEMRVGALGRNAIAPHFYAFTWSPIGVATEYIKDAEILRNHKLEYRASLSETKTLIIGGRVYEEDFTSGGAADLPIALADKITNLDYKTLRYPGHFQWAKDALEQCPNSQDPIAYLEEHMLSQIPRVEDDEVIVYAAVQGTDAQGMIRRIEVDYRVFPLKIGNGFLRAIQSTTAAGMAECARMLLTKDIKGHLLQSQLDPEEYLNGPFVSLVYTN